MTYINNIQFRGSGECAGSAARKVRRECPPETTCPPETLERDTVNFRGSEAYPYYTEQKKASPLLKLTTILIGAAGIIGGLGWAHKAGVIGKLKDGAFKAKFAEPVTNKCHEWCAWAKNTGVKGLDWVKNIFHKKG